MPKDENPSDLPRGGEVAEGGEPKNADGGPPPGISFGNYGTYIHGGESHTVGGHNDSPSEKKPPAWKVVVGLATVLGTVIAGLTLWVTLRDDSERKPPASSSSMPTSGATGTPVQQAVRVEAKVEKTWDVGSRTFVGVQSYMDPNEGGQGSAVGHFPEGGTIVVTCYIEDGREIEDAPWPGRLPSSKVWYKVENPRGHWVPGLYVGFPRPGGRPVNLQECP